MHHQSCSSRDWNATIPVIQSCTVCRAATHGHCRRIGLVHAIYVKYIVIHALRDSKAHLFHNDVGSLILEVCNEAHLQCMKMAV